PSAERLRYSARTNDPPSSPPALPSVAGVRNATGSAREPTMLSQEKDDQSRTRASSSAPGVSGAPGASGAPGTPPAGTGDRTRSGLLILDGHQFHRPSSTTVAGTSRVRTRKVSISTPSARPAPTSRNWVDPC